MRRTCDSNELPAATSATSRPGRDAPETVVCRRPVTHRRFLRSLRRCLGLLARRVPVRRSLASDRCDGRAAAPRARSALAPAPCRARRRAVRTEQRPRGGPARAGCVRQRRGLDRTPTDLVVVDPLHDPHDGSSPGLVAPGSASTRSSVDLTAGADQGRGSASRSGPGLGGRGVPVPPFELASRSTSTSATSSLRSAKRWATTASRAVAIGDGVFF